SVPMGPDVPSAVWAAAAAVIAAVAGAGGSGAGGGVGGAATAGRGTGGARGAAPAPRAGSSTCAADDPVPTPPGWQGWDRSGVIAWEEIEALGGIVPDIDEDRSQAPPAWWRYPSPLRSAALLEA